MKTTRQWIITIQSTDTFGDLYAHVNRIRAMEPAIDRTASIVLHVEAQDYVAIAARIPPGGSEAADEPLALDPGHRHTRILGMTVWRPR